MSPTLGGEVDGVSQQYKNMKWSQHGMNSILGRERLDAAGLSGFI